ncbi:glucose-6-phosphate dehydrogenase [Acidipila sp. EB88]|uniref:glucose-6-phosphate dehydrogenase n=1 Tax=Acidipila sp. EB88 TaxID=2305226 RepID=UPI000F5ECEBF|nr:glucose-6-phosphate dehydrogenase [Acidipila sp. EB88]RRA48512.1 glucose-6-phosphate dehydrogenase [Acidipila sp. EB88]
MQEAQATQVPGCLMTIFGASGDLCKRLLLPSLYNLVAAKVLPDTFQLLGVAMDAWDDAKFRDHVSTTLKEFWGEDADAGVVSWITDRSHYQTANFTEPASFDTVKSTIEALEKKAQGPANRLFYLAVAPSFIATMASQLSRTELLTEDEHAWRRLVIEKPFGHDLESAVALNAELQKSLREDQIYRIDHFAGKDAVQDLAVFRFSNAVFEPLWNRSMIDNVQITAAETVGVEGRAGYYEASGALRDMVPNHMAELLSLVAMEPPVSLSAEHMRNKQVELLQSIRPIAPDEVDKSAVRGQYGAGKLKGADVPGYRKEPGVKPESNTETYVAMRVEIDNWRWSGVPFYLRTGKRLSCAMTEIVVTFRQPPARLFPQDHQKPQSPNQLFFNLQPEQSIELSFGTKAPGIETVVEHGAMRFQFPAGPFKTHGKGYERLLHDVMKGDATLFQRAEFVEAGWRMVQPLLDAWKSPAAEFPDYAAGSTGPDAADALLATSGHTWHSLEQA